MESDSRSTPRRPSTALSTLLASLFAVGCGGGDPFPVVPVYGRVVYDDGSPIPAEQVSVRFDSLTPPLDAKTYPRPGMAVTGPDGEFEVATTHRYGDGIIRGKHKVLISATGAGGERLAPKEYSRFETTPLEVDSADTPFEFRIPRP